MGATTSAVAERQAEHSTYCGARTVPPAGTDPADILCLLPETGQLQTVSIHGWQCRPEAYGGKEFSHPKNWDLADLHANPNLLRKWAREMAAKGYQLFWRRNTTYKMLPRKTASTPDIKQFDSLALDAEYCTPQEALDAIASIGLPAPSLVITTGRGVHLYWRLSCPVSRTQGEPIQARWTKDIASRVSVKIDTLCVDGPRLLRLPTSPYLKTTSDDLSEIGIDDQIEKNDTILSDLEVYGTSETVYKTDISYSLSDLCHWIDQTQQDDIHLEDDRFFALQQIEIDRINTHRVNRDSRLALFVEEVERHKANRRNKRGRKQTGVQAAVERSLAQKAMKRDAVAQSLRTSSASLSSPPPLSRSSPWDVGALESEKKYQPYRTGRAIAFPLAVRSVERMIDPEFVQHIQSVADRVTRASKGDRNRPMAEYVGCLRRSYACVMALTEAEAIYAHDVWFRTYDGATSIEQSRGEFIYCYTTMPAARHKRDWLGDVRASGVLAHPLRDKIKGRKDGVANAQRLADLIYTACQRPDPASNVKAGRCAMAKRTAAMALDISDKPAGKILKRLEALDLIRMVYLGNLATGMASEFVCLDANGNQIGPPRPESTKEDENIIQDRLVVPGAWRKRREAREATPKPRQSKGEKRKKAIRELTARHEAKRRAAVMSGGAG